MIDAIQVYSCEFKASASITEMPLKRECSTHLRRTEGVPRDLPLDVPFMAAPGPDIPHLLVGVFLVGEFEVDHCSYPEYYEESRRQADGYGVEAGVVAIHELRVSVRSCNGGRTWGWTKGAGGGG
jgi:hypothetical protein